MKHRQKFPFFVVARALVRGNPVQHHHWIATSRKRSSQRQRGEVHGLETTAKTTKFAKISYTVYIKICTFDTETTGLDQLTDEVIQFAALYGDNTDGNYTEFEIYIKTSAPLPTMITELTGITDNKLNADGLERTAGELQMLEFVKARIEEGYLMVAANAAFDISFLYIIAQRHNFTIDFDIALIGDIQVIDKQLDKYRKGGRSVSVIAPIYGVELSAQMHNALEDVRVEHAIFLKQLEDSKLKDLSAEIISKTVILRAKEQQQDLYKYFEKKHPEKLKNFQLGYPIYDSLLR